jgi:hypothetical protein
MRNERKEKKFQIKNRQIESSFFFGVVRGLTEAQRDQEGPTARERPFGLFKTILNF